MPDFNSSNILSDLKKLIEREYNELEIIIYFLILK